MFWILTDWKTQCSSRTIMNCFTVFRPSVQSPHKKFQWEILWFRDSSRICQLGRNDDLWEHGRLQNNPDSLMNEFTSQGVPEYLGTLFSTFGGSILLEISEEALFCFSMWQEDASSEEEAAIATIHWGSVQSEAWSHQDQFGLHHLICSHCTVSLF